MKITSLFREKPLISLLHTSARLPDGFMRAFNTWRDRAVNPARIEYVLCVDKDTPNREAAELAFRSAKGFGSKVFTVNDKRQCAVDGWNCAAAASSGKLLITVSDDLFPPERWDVDLLTAVADLDRQAVVDIEAGSGDLMTFSLLTRAYYERYGYVFYPEYLGMLGDNDFTSQAHADGVVITARHLKFTHEHPAYHTAAMDATYAHQHRAEAWAVGKRTYRKRFPTIAREALAVCTPGETFNFQWVSNALPLFINLHARFHLLPHFAYSSNVHVTRQSIADGLTRNLGPSMPPDYVFWFDDDNTPKLQDFMQLFQDLQDDPELDIVTGWCWAGVKGTDPNNPKVSCGFFDGNDLAVHFGYQDLMAGGSDLVPVEFSGFPTLLMRYDALVRAGETPFAPRLNAKHPWGFNSEDTSFFLNARDRGPLRVACDRRVKVTHWKFGMDEVPVSAVPAAPLTETLSAGLKDKTAKASAA